MFLVTATARRGRPVEKALRAGRDVLFDIDWQGTQQLREKARDDLVSVFILPPTAKELERRLHRRAQDSKTMSSRARMAKAAGEMSHWPEYDYVIVNNDTRRGLCRSAGDPRRGAAQARAPGRPFGLRTQSAGEIMRSCAGHSATRRSDRETIRLEHRAADDAAGAQIVKRGLSLAKRAGARRDRRDLARLVPDRSVRGPRRACPSACPRWSSP